MLSVLKHIWALVRTDRIVQVGSGTSSVSLWGSWNLAEANQHISLAQQWVALYAAVIGALMATATLTYTVIRIVRLLKNPAAKE